MIYVLIYLLGIIATLWTWYHTLDRGTKITLSDLTFAILMSLFSWLTFFILTIIVYGDTTIFEKK